MRFFRKVFSKEKPGSTLERENPFFIYDREETLKILTNLQKAAGVISLYFPDRPQNGYASSLVRVDPNSLLLDQVNHPRGHDLLLARKSFRALTKYKGVSVTFDCRLLALAQEGESVRYKVTFPQRLYYPQKREFFRVRVHPLQLPVHISNTLDGGTGPTTLVGRIDDIGPHGIGFFLESDSAIRKFDLLPSCGFRTLSDQYMSFDIEVRSVLPLGYGKRKRVGGRFVNMTKKKAATMRRELLQLQRRMRAEKARG